MPIPGWSPAGGSWTTRLPGWPQPPPPPDYESINASLQSRSVTVSLNGFKASNVPLVGGGEEISLTTLEGWWDSVGDATDTTRHPAGDGDVAFRLRQGGRVITVAGMIEADYKAPDAGRLLALMDEVSAQTRSGTLVVHERLRNMRREVDVRRQSMQMTPLSHAYAIFTLVLVADDPLRYGSTSVALPRNSLVRVTGSGDVHASPILEWTGAATNPGLDFGNLSWRLGQNTAAGDRMLVDCRNGDVYRNGSRIFPSWTGYWPLIQGGPGETPCTAIGTDMTMRRRSAWS